MAGGRERVLRRRIGSVQNTKKITRAMELIAATRVAKAQQLARAARPYANQITTVIENLAAGGAEVDHPLLREAEQVQMVGVIVIASDRGLAGPYNSSVIRAAERQVQNARAESADYSLIVVGKKAQRVSVSEARDCIFGVTCGNDVSARDWQSNDLQWWRAKGSDPFAPMGPAIARGISYNSLQLTTRLNGQVKQQQTTADLIFNVETILSYASQYVTLFPGDVIFTGTPGQTSAMSNSRKRCRV